MQLPMMATLDTAEFSGRLRASDPLDTTSFDAVDAAGTPNACFARHANGAATTQGRGRRLTTLARPSICRGFSAIQPRVELSARVALGPASKVWRSSSDTAPAGINGTAHRA
jgi:hypothetical protein